MVIVGVACSFLFMDFGASRSETSVNSRAEKFAYMDEMADVSGEIYLYVDGGEEVDSVLGDELECIASRVVEFAKRKDEFDGPLVAVAVMWEDIDYTPLYSQAEMNVLYFFLWIGLRVRRGMN